MLRRQQAEAVIAARQKIVHGAVSMVDMALRDLAEKQVVQLDDERKAAMVSNLMVVLCGESVTEEFQDLMSCLHSRTPIHLCYKITTTYSCFATKTVEGIGVGIIPKRRSAFASAFM